jgi:putative chitinase
MDMVGIDAARLQRLVPALGAAKSAAWARALSSASMHAGITSHRAMAHWLGQTCHESAGFTVVEEALSYSAGRLVAVWPGRFSTLEAAAPFARNPKALANRVYNGRMGNRPGSDDGWHFRGRGPTQLTGRSNYTAFETWADGVLERRTEIRVHPDQLLAPEMGALSAGWFWMANGLGALVEASRDEAAVCERICLRINGGRTGLAARLAWTRQALALWP